MSMTCSLRGHRPSAPLGRNQGFEFARCTACERDLIRTHVHWVALPSQLRVTWRARPAAQTRPVRGPGTLPVATTAPAGELPVELLRMAGAFLMWRLRDRLRVPRLPRPARVPRLPAPSYHATEA